MLFEKSEHTRSTVRSQTEEKSADSREMVLDVLNETIGDYDCDEFTVLSLANRKHNIAYVQSAWTPNGLLFISALRKRTAFVEKYCSPKECIDICRKLYDTGDVSDIQDYSEVKF
ncbi:MAG: hypothetical protein NC299_09665 [Lachnospiraceae bacterium]|nr:hypothetical protein [Ruminococcus sp.]MCM1275620.1 hypothetical protein [Lachnospiraceae bacterium]